MLGVSVATMTFLVPIQSVCKMDSVHLCVQGGNSLMLWFGVHGASHRPRSSVRLPVRLLHRPTRGRTLDIAGRELEAYRALPTVTVAWFGLVGRKTYTEDKIAKHLRKTTRHRDPLDTARKPGEDVISAVGVRVNRLIQCLSF